MKTIFKLIIDKPVHAHVKTLNLILNSNSKNETLNLLSKKTDESTFLTASFSFKKWKISAMTKLKKEEALKSKYSKSKKIGQMKYDVAEKIIEAAHSEVTASNLTVDIDANQDEIIFKSKKVTFENSNQIQQTGVYLHQKLEQIFHELQLTDTFPAIRIMEPSNF